MSKWGGDNNERYQEKVNKMNIKTECYEIRIDSQYSVLSGISPHMQLLSSWEHGLSGDIVRPFTDSYLLEYSHEHVFYELDRFFSLVEICTSKNTCIDGPSPLMAHTVNCSLIEAFGIHTRNVIDFLYINAPKPTDVIAADFCTPGSWEGVRPPITETLKTAKTRADKELAHLTTSRISGAPPEKEWQFSALAAEIRPILKVFVSSAETTRLATRVARVIR